MILSNGYSAAYRTFNMICSTRLNSRIQASIAHLHNFLFSLRMIQMQCNRHFGCGTRSSSEMDKERRVMESPRKQKDLSRTAFSFGGLDHRSYCFEIVLQKSDQSVR